MKLSMSMILQGLSMYDCEAQIVSDAARITGLRALLESDGELQDSHAYLAQGRAPGTASSAAAEDIILVNGKNRIKIFGGSYAEVLNAILARFELCESWERRMKALAAEHASLQEMLDESDAMLDNPAFVMDFEGNLLAISPYHENRKETEFYKEFRQSGKVSPKSTSLAMTDKNGNPVMYGSSNIPVFTPNNAEQLPFLPATIVLEGEPAAILIVSQSNLELASPNRHVIRQLLKFLPQAAEFREGASQTLPLSAILRDLLDGKEVDDTSINRLAATAMALPYSLLVFHSTVAADDASQRLNAGQLSRALTDAAETCIHTVYANDAFALVTAANVKSFLSELSRTYGLKNWQVGISLPFGNFRTMPLRYRQARFALAQADEKPGIFRCNDYALEYLIGRVRASDDGLELRHPAIIMLKHYDEEHGTDFSETLFQYLRHERNLVKTASELCVHRNSLTYRLNRIREICRLGFDDPEENAYILLSYYLDTLGIAQQRHIADRTYSSLHARSD